MPRPTEKSHVLRELLETAIDLKTHGLLSKPEMARMNALCEKPPTYTPDKVVEIRTSIVKVSQSVFASLLNVSVSTVQKWESPSAEKRPSGAAAKLLQLVENKGIQVLIP